MNEEELVNWLLAEGVASDLSLLTRVNALQELENVEPVQDIQETTSAID